MTNTPEFTSCKIADEMTKVFGSEAKTVTVDMKYRTEVGEFVLKVERAHKEAEESVQVFK